MSRYSFFSVHVALRYLTVYSDNIGITYYLTRRLREMDIHILREVWGFIWYSCWFLRKRPLTKLILAIFSSPDPLNLGH
jgi:phosphatidylinositol 4-kinase B